MLRSRTLSFYSTFRCFSTSHNEGKLSINLDSEGENSKTHFLAQKNSKSLPISNRPAPILDPEDFKIKFEEAIKEAISGTNSEDYLNVDISSAESKLSVFKSIYKHTGRQIPARYLNTIQRPSQVLEVFLAEKNYIPVTDALEILLGKGELPSNVRVAKPINRRVLYAGLSAEEREKRMKEDRER